MSVYERAVEINMNLTNILKNKLTSCCKDKRHEMHVNMLHVICCYIREKCTTLKTCAKLHRFHVLHLPRACKIAQALFHVLQFHTHATLHMFHDLRIPHACKIAQVSCYAHSTRVQNCTVFEFCTFHARSKLHRLHGVRIPRAVVHLETE